MMQRIKSISVFAVLLLLVTCLAFGGVPEKDKVQGVQKTTTNGLYRPFLINSIFNYYSNVGDGSYNKFSGDNEGFEFPKGSGHTCIFEDGVCWGGFHMGALKVGGSVYRHALQAGPIVANGINGSLPTPANANDPKYRIYRVRPDINPKVKFEDIASNIETEERQYIIRFESYSAQDIYNQYIKDWNEWPADEGAPYTDVNHNGQYDPTVDIPGQPGADQTLWYVANDADVATTEYLAGDEPIGVEMQRTIWGYRRSGALGVTIFASTKLINKSGAPVDSMYLVQWADPDLGTATDDFVGCDTTRSLGYVYNGLSVDGQFGSAVPAAGFTFFQGPIVATGNPSDSAVFQLKYRYGYKNLKMSAFNFFVNGNNTYTDPEQGTATGGKQWYNLMNGLVSTSGAEYTDPAGIVTKFTLAGDPVTGKGWIDGSVAPPGDRRMCLVTGPFTLGATDTQELVVANLVGQGGDRISSIPVLRYYSDLAQRAYNLLFDLPNPPPTPDVKVTQLNNEILLSWSDTAKANILENWDSKGYKFEGYNVWQMPGPSFDPTTARRLATYDLVNGITLINDYEYDANAGTVLFKPVEHGGDNGIARFIDITNDAINARALVNGTKYYFAVTAYSYNPDPSAKPDYLESSAIPFTVVPQSDAPGQRTAGTGVNVPITHIAGISTAIPEVKVIDPTKLPAHDYEFRITVTDSVENPDLGVNVANPKWQLFDVTSNTIVAPPSTVYSGVDQSNTIYNGFQVALSGAPFYKYGAELGSQTYTANFAEVNFGSPLSSGGIAVGNDFFGRGILAPQDVTQDVQVNFVAQGSGQNAYRFLRDASSTGAPYQDFVPQPFTVWELNADGTHRRQIDFLFLEQKGQPTVDNIWAPTPTSAGREYWFIVAETYSATAKAKYQVGTTTIGTALDQDSCAWSGWYVLNNTSLPAYKPGDVWTIKATKIVTAADKWSFSLKGVAQVNGNTDLAKADVNMINVFPNPYFGFNTQEQNKSQRFVTFNHLPVKATIRIYNLAGVLVKTILKNDTGQFAQWDLNNQAGFPASAGMYVVFIDMPDLGKTKTLKLGIIPETQYLDRY